MKRYIIFTLAFLFAACGSKKETQDVSPVQIENKRTSVLIEEVEKNDFKADFVTLKSSVTIERGEKSNTIKASIRIKPDSVVWISASALGYEAFRLMARQDSIFLMDRTEKKFFAGSFDSLSSKMNLDLRFDFLQALILGNYIGSQPDLSVKKYKDKEYYLLSTVRKGVIKKADKKADEKPQKFDEYIFTNWIDPKTYKVERILARNIPENKEVTVEYANFIEVNNMLLAHEILCLLKTDNEVKVTITHNKVNLPEELSFPFRIPGKYDAY